MPIRDLSEIGRSGLSRAGYDITDEWHPHLVGRRAMSVYREMFDNDPVMGAAHNIVDLMLQHVGFPVRPRNSSAEAERWAEHVRSCIGDMDHSFRGFLSESLTMMPFGFAVFEVVYKIRKGDSTNPALRSDYNDGLVGWRKFSPRAQESLDGWLYRGNEPIAMIQRAPPDYNEAVIPLNKTIHFKYRDWRESPEGRSAYRTAYTSYFFAKKLRIVEAIALERLGAGLPVMEVPPEMLDNTATDSDNDTAIAGIYKMLRSIRRDGREGIVIPSEKHQDGGATGYKLRFENTGISSALDIHRTIVRHEHRMAMTVLTDFMFLGLDKGAAQALSRDKHKLFLKSLEAIAENIVTQFNRHAIPSLMKLNGVPPELWPEMTYDHLDSPDLNVISGVLAGLVNTGALTMTEGDQNWLRDLLTMPQKLREAV